MERVVTVVQRQEGLGKACSETPGRWNVKPEVCNRFACPTDPPEEPDETTDGPGGDGPRFGLDDTLGEGGRGGCKLMPFILTDQPSQACAKGIFD